VPNALQLSAAAGWNQTAADWRMVIELEPEGCFGLECDGQLAATTSLVCYGSRLAWLGMVLTRADFQHRGFARTLVARALEFADRKGIETVKLDATDQGQPLYETLGFVAEQPVERWGGTGGGSASALADFQGNTIEQLEREVFPAGRSGLLNLLAVRNKPLVCEDGYLFWRPGSRASYLGPCSARTPAAAERLIASCLAGSEGPWMWDVLPENAEAVALAKRFGFTPKRRLVRMYRGAKSRGADGMVYAIAGFELG
jgi:GNAT superfamily N-acetyltransferase